MSAGRGGGRRWADAHQGRQRYLACYADKSDNMFIQPYTEVLILIFNQNKIFAMVFFGSCFVTRLGNTYSIPGAAFLARHEKSSLLGVLF